MNRRHMIRSLALGSSLFPALLSDLLAKDSVVGAPNPLAPKAPHFPGTAKRVIFIYLSGGPLNITGNQKVLRAAPSHPWFADRGRKNRYARSVPWTAKKFPGRPPSESK